MVATRGFRSQDDLPWISANLVAEEGSYLCNWFPSAPRANVEEDVVGLGSYQRLLTILITDWDAEESEEDELGDDDYIDRWKEGMFRRK